MSNIHKPVEVPPERQHQETRYVMIALVLAVTLASIIYRALEGWHIGRTSAMFIGIPGILAIALAFTPRAVTVTGGIMKAITFFLLIVAPILGEGWFCIVIASPVFYVVGLVVGLVADRARRKRNTSLSCVALLLIPMSLEGVIPPLTFDRFETVSVTRVVNAPSAAVEQTLAASPRVAGRTGLPLLLRIGFPVPLSAQGGGIDVGDRRSVLFSGVEGYPPGNLVVGVAARRPGYLRLDAISDDSKLDHWLHWQDAEVEWQSIDPTHTRVTCRIQFQRRLDPAWYFIPWERAAVHQAASFLIANGATPAA